MRYTRGPMMDLDRCRTATLRLGVVTLMFAGCAGIWELLALQSPGTPFYIGVLPGPVSALRELATAVGLLLVAAAVLMPSAARGRIPVPTLVALLYAGTLLSLGAQLYGAAHGMYGVQISDLRADALPLFAVKHGGLALLGTGLFELGRRVLLAKSPPT